MSQKLFAELGLAPELLKALERMGFEQASPVQAEAIPPLLAGRDLVGQSQTGSGKTAAFGAPAVQLVDPQSRQVQVIVLCPTRELATQVAEEMAKLAHFKRGVRELPIYGGQSYDRQFRGLAAGPQIVIGTPGRVIDHLERGTLQLGAVRLVVLDEADRMLDMGFREDIEKILETVPATRQTVLFSATLPVPIRRLITRFTREPVEVRIEAAALTVPTVEQCYVEVDWRSKTEVLARLIDYHDLRYGLIFGTTKAQVDELTEALAARGYSADKLHGDMAQGMRDRVMRRLRERKIEFLVATDLAARGLDVDDLEAVVNYELPWDAEDYVHRIGRTGRAGKFGRAISLVSGREFGRLQQIMRFTKARIHRIEVPRLEELEQKSTGRLVEALQATLEAGQYPRQEALLRQLTEAGHMPGDIVAALLHLFNTELARPPERIAEDEPGSARRERPRRESRPVREGEWAGGDPRRAGTPRMFWLEFNLGANAGVQPGDFVGCIAGETGLPREIVGAIRVQPDRSYVEVAKDCLEEVLAAVNRTRIKGRRVMARLGRPQAGRADAVRGRGRGGPAGEEG
ncbi:MAG: DEAD/DEAH box helicase [Verrucomicrobia bacterium]|nr:DEAD/DEAH box helicase [Verrucomicrobiota bacterium]